MNRKVAFISLVVTVLFGVFGFRTLEAQRPQGGPGGPPGAFPAMQRIEGDWAALAFELKVDVITLERARPHFQAAWDERERLRRESASDPAVLSAEMNKVNDRLDEKLKGILSEDQLKRLAERRRLQPRGPGQPPGGLRQPPGSRGAPTSRPAGSRELPAQPDLLGAIPGARPPASAARESGYRMPPAENPSANISYPVVGTGQSKCHDNSNEITCPQPGQPFYGQDAQHPGYAPRYRNNGDGTITDLNTGLTWVQARGSKMSWADASAGAARSRVGGYSDWRMPAIKELYSLINFNGKSGRSANDSTPYIDTNYFGFAFGDTSAGERLIDCQDWSATQYVGTTMNGDATVFGVNFCDGRIKGYPKADRRPDGARLNRYVRYVRGNTRYGVNNFVDNGTGTVTDKATGLMWQKADSGATYKWKDALGYCSTLKLAGYDDWRLPNAKELQSIVDYSRAPLVTNSAAINPVFAVFEKESYYWTSTTHREGPGRTDGSSAVYIAFGRCMGYMQFPGSPSAQFIDVHGAGAQRSDPKDGDPANYPQGLGPQGDDIRIYNYARCVRNATAGP